MCITSKRFGWLGMNRGRHCWLLQPLPAWSVSDRIRSATLTGGCALSLHGTCWYN